MDDRPVDEEEARRLATIIKACWSALDRAAAAADGLVLRTGPRGGGRQLAAIMEHVTDAEVAYLSKLGARRSAGDARATILAVFASRAGGEPPERTRRSGLLWTPRYFMRRAAWHVLELRVGERTSSRPVA